MHNENKLLSGQIKYISIETTEKQTDFIVCENITVIFQKKTGKKLTHKLSAGNSKFSIIMRNKCREKKENLLTIK